MTLGDGPKMLPIGVKQKAGRVLVLTQRLKVTELNVYTFEPSTSAQTDVTWTTVFNPVLK